MHLGCAVGRAGALEIEFESQSRRHFAPKITPFSMPLILGTRLEGYRPELCFSGAAIRRYNPVSPALVRHSYAFARQIIYKRLALTGFVDGE